MLQIQTGKVTSSLTGKNNKQKKNLKEKVEFLR